MKHLSLVLIFIYTIAQLLLPATINCQGFYDINTINTIEITFEESNWDQILDQLYEDGDEERLVGTVLVNGQFFDSVGIRYKGNSSYRPNQVKNPLNIKLDHVIDDQDIEGYGTLKLANGFKDPTLVREVLSYEIAGKYFPSSLANYANVYINGTHLGLYTSVQSVDRFFMQTHFGSDENTRVKGELTTNGPPTGGVWEYYGSDSSNYYGYFDMKSDYGWDNLIDFLDTLNNHNESVDQLLNIDRHLWFLAFSNLLVNLDGPINNPQNHYLYKEDNGRFNPIPWDLNESFGVFTGHQILGHLNTYQLQTFSPFANLNENEFPVISKILSNDTYRKIYVAHMKTIIEENFENELYETRTLELQDFIDADVQADQNKLYSYADFISNVYNTVGGGPQAIIGIVQLMDARIDYLQSLTDFQYAAPEISNAGHIPDQVPPGSTVWITAEVENTENVFLAYRSNSFDVFEKTLMYDDGNHEDGQAGDGIYGISILAGSTDIQYYIYAENTNAVAFSPVRAAYEFYEISISADVVINEFMADNENAVADQDGEYDDWIELYNNGSEDINLGGYFLSDDADEPDKWAFPDTTIFAGDYLIVWADKDEDQEGLHAGIKLSADGEIIVFSDSYLNLLDEISFGPQKADTSTGRFPNGTGDFIEMLPTFGAENTNILTIVENTVSTVFELEQNYPNPFSGLTNIDFKTEKAGEVVLCIHDSHGRKLATLVSTFLPAGEYSFQWDAQNHCSGFYIYLFSFNGRTMFKKMVVR